MSLGRSGYGPITHRATSPHNQENTMSHFLNGSNIVPSRRRAQRPTDWTRQLPTDWTRAIPTDWTPRQLPTDWTARALPTDWTVRELPTDWTRPGVAPALPQCPTDWTQS
ncbi:hypothetical protein GCM10017567_49350 [Amycolatopsis bullii]|uniref:Uncharacterized protein n=2 Tax=Amycolatopsis TaxID=1813 RepID=A0ABQ3KHK3_9PSEU|nr:hypothetical protein GCM10017567_49350 [Amycolatopsis bullii]